MTRIDMLKFQKQMLEHKIKAIEDNIELLFHIIYVQNKRIKQLESKKTIFEKLWK